MELGDNITRFKICRCFWVLVARVSLAALPKYLIIFHGTFFLCELRQLWCRYIVTPELSTCLEKGDDIYDSMTRWMRFVNESESFWSNWSIEYEFKIILTLLFMVLAKCHIVQFCFASWVFMHHEYDPKDYMPWIQFHHSFQSVQRLAQPLWVEWSNCVCRC